MQAVTPAKSQGSLRAAVQEVLKEDLNQTLVQAATVPVPTGGLLVSRALKKEKEKEKAKAKENENEKEKEKERLKESKSSQQGDDCDKLKEPKGSLQDEGARSNKENVYATLQFVVPLEEDSRNACTSSSRTRARSQAHRKRHLHSWQPPTRGN